jgi:hypothetical protein
MHLHPGPLLVGEKSAPSPERIDHENRHRAMFEEGAPWLGLGFLPHLAATEPSDRADGHLVAIWKVRFIVPDDDLKPSRLRLPVKASSGFERTKRFGQVAFERTVVNDDGTCIYLIRVQVRVSSITHMHPQNAHNLQRFFGAFLRSGTAIRTQRHSSRRAASDDRQQENDNRERKGLFHRHG